MRVNEYEDLRKLEKQVKKLNHEYRNQHKYISSLLIGNNAMNKRIAELEKKVQYVIDNYLMEFEPALTKLKELEQKLSSYIKKNELYFSGLKGEVHTLSAVIKESIEFQISWIERAFKIDNERHRWLKEDQRWHLIDKHRFNKEQLKKLDRATEGEPCSKCKHFGLPIVL